MASIDERVVAMSFENAKFEAGVAQTMVTLQKLNVAISTVGSSSGFADIDKAANKVTLDGPMTALDKLRAKLGLVGADTTGFSDIEKGANKVQLNEPMTALSKLEAKLGGVGANAGIGFSDIEKASNKVTLQGVNDAVDQASKHFTMLDGIASVALGNITSQAAMRGAQMAKSFSLGPIIDGFKEYTTNLNSIQTILANTKQSGATLDDVNNALQNLNKYSDETIYNFGQMAKNIGTFTSAGVDLDTSVKSIKGIANIAALSGANAEQAASAMYQLSQAIAAGKVGAQDWNSIVNASMASSQFKKSLVDTGLAMGTIEKGTVQVLDKMGNLKIAGESFRDSIMSKPGKESWLTSKVLTATLSQFSGDLTDAQLKAQGFNDSQIKAIRSVAATAKASATEVKNIGQVFDIAKETMGSGWAQTFQTIFGNFGEAKTLFTSFSNYLGGLITANANARNKILADWKELGGRKDLIQGLKNVWEALLAIIKPIKDAFRDIFPKATGKDLAELTHNFEKFTEKLKIGPATAEELRRTFDGLFSLFHIGVSIVKEIARVIGDLLGEAGKGAGGFLSMTGTIGDWIKAVDTALTKGGLLTSLFNGIEAVLKVPIHLLGVLAGALAGLFDKGNSKGAAKFGDDMKQVGVDLAPVQKILQGIANAWHGIFSAIKNAANSTTGVLGRIVTQAKEFAKTIRDGIANANWEKIFQGMQVGLLGAIWYELRKGLTGKSGIGAQIVEGMQISKLNDALKALTGNLTALQRNLQARALLTIAVAIGVLAAGVLALSQIDSKSLTRAMTAVAVGLAELVAALGLLGKTSSVWTGFSMAALSASLVMLATGVTILAGAVTIFSKLSWDELIRGLAGTAGVIGGLALASRLIPLNLPLVAASLIPLGIALNIIAMAVGQFAKLSWKELLKGFVGLTSSLAGLGLAMQAFTTRDLIIGPTLIAVAIALNMLAGAMVAFGRMDLASIGKGVLGIAGSLVAIGLAMKVMPKGIAVQAAGLTLLSIALTGLSVAVAAMGNMKVGTLVKGIISMAGMLVVLAAGLDAMETALPGAAAVMVAALAFTMLAPALGLMGSLDIVTIVKGLASMAAVLVTLSLVGKFAAIGLQALGVALLPLAGALALVAIGIYALASALSLLSDKGVKGITVIVAAITAFTAALPSIVINFLKGMVAVLEGLANIAPKIVDSLSKIISAVIQVVINETPKLAEAISVLISQFLKVIVEKSPEILAAGFKVLDDFLSGLIQNMPNIVAKGSEVVIKFLDGLASKIDRIVASGANLVVNFLNGIAKKAVDLVGAAGNVLVKFMNGVAQKLPDIIKAGANMVVSFIKGVGDNVFRIAREATNTATKFMKALADQGPRLIGAGMDMIINILNGIAKQIHDKKFVQRLMDAGWNIAWALIEGFLQGMVDLGHKIMDKVKDILLAPINWVKDQLDIFSPSGVTRYYGQMVSLGFAMGIDDNARKPLQSTKNMVQAVADTVNNLSDDIGGNIDLSPTITPVLDLTQVQKDASQLKDLTNVVPITAAASYDSAANISAEKSAADLAAIVEATKAATPSFSFEQNNYSPESLSDIEIYRQTRNQLSQVKSALGLP